MKTWYDKNDRERSFQPGDQLLVLLPIPGRPLQARYSGPYQGQRKVNDVDYIIQTPERRKHRRMCDINMKREYYDRDGKPVVIIQAVKGDLHNESVEDDVSDIKL